MQGIDRDKVGAKRTHSGGVPQKYVLDDYKRRLIIEMYNSTSTSVETIAAKIGVPRRIVSKWAAQLGVSRHSGKRWTERETAYLKRNFHKKGLEHVASQLQRSPDSVHTKARQLGLTGIAYGYTKQDLMAGLGVSSHNTIDKWIAKGWLKGNKKGNSISKHWEFSDKHIRDFIISHPDEINHRLIDWLWVVDILAGERGLGRLDDHYERGEE